VGGAKEVAYIGWCKAAEQVGVLKQISHLAGSSIGALTAAFIASGMSANELERATQEQSFLDLLIKESFNRVMTEHTLLIEADFFSGTVFIEAINAAMVKSIRRYLQSLEKTGVLEKKIVDAALNDKEQATLQKLIDNLVRRPSAFYHFFSKKPMAHLVTFRELALLTKIDSRFKDLTITAYDVTAKKEIDYNAKNFPKKQIAEAVRASISLLLVNQPILDNMIKNQLEDGDLGSRSTSEVFIPEGNHPEKLEEFCPKKVVLRFDNDGLFYNIVNRGQIDQELDTISSWTNSHPRSQQDTDADHQKLHDVIPNAEILTHGQSGLLSLLSNSETIQIAQRQAEICAMETFALRYDQATDYLFNSLQHAMKAMSKEELKSIKTLYDLHAPQYNLNNDEEKQKRVGNPLANEIRRTVSQTLSHQESLQIFQAAEEELATRFQLQLPLLA
jgi:predicted acylesterase/phospholipase RssA